MPAQTPDFGWDLPPGCTLNDVDPSEEDQQAHDDAIADKADHEVDIEFDVTLE